MNYKKINRREARKRYETSKPFIMVPGDLRPDSWVASLVDNDTLDASFDELCNAFSYYNGSISKKISFWVAA